jgi:hypothetical protein
MGYDHVREMDTVTEGGVEQVGDYEGTTATPYDTGLQKWGKHPDGKLQR